MNIEEKNGIYYISGTINEETKLNNFNLPSGKLKFDLSNLKNINSTGLQIWINGLAKQNIIPTYLNCPHFFVLLLNMVRELFENGASIESFQITTTCLKCANNKILVVRLGHEFFPGKPFTYKLPKCEIDGGELDTECDLASDYCFIEELEPK